MAYVEKNYATAAESNYKTGSTVAPQNPNFAASVDYADERVGVLVSRLEQLCNKLCGTVPEAAGNSPRSVPNGLLDEVMSRAGDIAQRAEVGLELLSRIERSLP